MEQIELGGFRVQKTHRGAMAWMRIEARAGYWTMTLRNDNVMYNLIDKMLEVGYTEYVHSYIQQCFVASSVSPDAEWAEDFAQIYEKYVQRHMPPEEPTEEEQKEALDEAIGLTIAKDENSSSDE